MPILGSSNISILLTVYLGLKLRSETICGALIEGGMATGTGARDI